MTTIAGLALDDLLALRSLDRAGVAARFGGARTTPDVRYEGIEGVDRLDPEDLPAHFFFLGDEQLMLYVPRRALADVGPEQLRAELGPPAASLRSRTGGDSQLLVWPDQGVAFATDGASVEILEVFPPTTLEDYSEHIYQDPGEFFR